jgi:hypothetical protein
MTKWKILRAMLRTPNRWGTVAKLLVSDKVAEWRQAWFCGSGTIWRQAAGHTEHAPNQDHPEPKIILTGE